MSKVIAGIYEIQKQIGAGGGGIVYLGWHLRMNKQIVLKADRRTLNTKAEILRREVDTLKGLHNTYIPQVHDFVQEDGMVYTVMDFIEGESLDQLLKRGERPAQPQVIRWACQLLSALDYLHGQPPHGILHGDIKPANVMVRPDGDICLIDFNIALALGEDGAVRAGFSRGYASPEHYGIEYGSYKKDEAIRQNSHVRGRKSGGDTDITERVVLTEDTASTEITDHSRFSEHTEKTEVSEETTESAKTAGFPKYMELSKGLSLSSTNGRCVLLDVRSDIYSLGATLYHLLSGRRPAPNALEVEPLGPDICSPAVSAIIRKAMDSNPDMRYQTAAEMLHAFRQLPKQDIRVIRHRRRAITAAILLSFLFLGGGVSAFAGMKQLEQTQRAMTLAEYSANSLAKGDVTEAIRLALQALPEKESIFDPPVTAQAQKALTDALGVYELWDGFKFLNTIELPSAPFTVAISPSGSYFAAVYQGEAVVFEMESGRRAAKLPAENSALSDVIFVNDTQIVYAGEQGVTAYDLTLEKILWTGEAATTLAVSGDKNIVAAVNRNEDHASIYRMRDGAKIEDCSFEGKQMNVAANDIFANPANRIFALNETGELLAVSFSDGGLEIFDRNSREEDLIIYEESAYGDFQGGFFGKYFAFGADKGDESVFGLVDAKDGVYVGEYESRDQFLVKTDERGIYFANGNLLVSFDPDTYEQTELAYTEDRHIIGFSVGDGYVLAATDDKGFTFYDSGANPVSPAVCEERCDFVAMAGEYALAAGRNGPAVRLLKRESHEESQVMSYDARYPHDEARVSQDGRTVMLFDYEEFRICDMEGNVSAQIKLPDPEHVYDQQFRKSQEGSWLEVTWYDGTVRCYDAADGSVKSETKGRPPSKDLYEEFCTDTYRIESPLHGVPTVYDLKSGRKAGELEEDSYLTYVTQAGDYLITEYVSAEGERYGLLLNERLQTLAYLPGLCDIWEDMLVFDYGSGDLRQCRLYSLQELKTLGEMYLQNAQQEGEES